jgi:isocitrate dehydrogenase
MSTKKTPITVAHGDGIGPEIMDATLKILDAAKAQLDIHEIEIGESLYNKGVMTGISDESWDTLRDTKVFLKAPIFTPKGGGFKSLNVTVRKTLGLYANVRPCMSYHPYVQTNFPNMDLVVVRENEEDLYAGVEYSQVDGAVQSVKMITRAGSERICRYAFEYAKVNGRKKITCMVKDNIMKMADGLFYEVFQEMAAEYPDIETERYIIDIGAARIAARPADFDVIVTENLYGDVISDIAAEVTGSVGLGISANIGESCAMFEAMHGTAPDIAGQGIANPSGLLLGSVMMLTHIGQGDIAAKVHNAWLKTIEDGIHTGDIYKDEISKARVGTKDFTNAVIERIGDKPETFQAREYPSGQGGLKMPPLSTRDVLAKELVGIDIYVEWRDADRANQSDALATLARQSLVEGIDLSIISNRGTKVWPDGAAETYCAPLWCLRFMSAQKSNKLMNAQVTKLLDNLYNNGLPFVKVEKLYEFEGGRPGYTKAQGE